MNYRVVWRSRVMQRLGTLMFLALEMGRDPTPIQQAAEELDVRLAADPANEGESRDDNERVAIAHPLSVIYEVFEAERVVLIYSAVVYPRQRA